MSTENKLPATQTGNSVAVSPAEKAGVLPFSMEPKSLGEAMAYARMIAASNLCPEAFRGKAGDVLIVMQMAHELAVPFFHALQRICVINGRPCIWGELGIALIQRAPSFEYLVDEFDEASSTATCKVKRRGRPERVATFSLADAKRAKLDQKDTYVKYQKDMLTWKARWRAIRPEFADVLAGMEIVEEVRDYPEPEKPREPIKVPRALVQEPQPPTQVGAPEAAQQQPASTYNPDGWDAFSADASSNEGPPTVPDAPPPPLTITRAHKIGSGKKDGVPFTKWAGEFSDGLVAFTYNADIYSILQKMKDEACAVAVTTTPHPINGELLIDKLEKAAATEEAPGPIVRLDTQG